MTTTLWRNFLPLAISLIGTEYVHGGKSPNGFDCWGLVWYFYKEMGHDIMLPTDYEGRSTFQQKNDCAVRVLETQCEEITEPTEGCMVAFSRGGLTIHCGIYLGLTEGCLHATEFGVVCEKIPFIQQNRNLTPTYYRWH